MLKRDNSLPIRLGAFHHILTVHAHRRTYITNALSENTGTLIREALENDSCVSIFHLPSNKENHASMQGETSVELISRSGIILTKLLLNPVLTLNFPGMPCKI